MDVEHNAEKILTADRGFENPICERRISNALYIVNIDGVHTDSHAP